MSRGDGGAASSPVPPSDEEEIEDIPRRGDRGRTRDRPSLPEGMNEMEQFRLFQRFMESQQRGRRSNLADESEGGGHGAEGRGGGAGPPPEWDGQTPFEDFLIRARLWIATTKTRPTARGPLLLKALKGPPFESFKHLAKDANWLNSASNADDLLKKMDTPDYFGDDREEHLLASLSRITYHMKRQKQESWRAYFARWESALRKVREHQVELPEPYLGFLLINGLRLEEQEIRSMLTFTQGDIQPKSIKAWLRKNESKLTANQLGADDSKKATPVYFAEEELSENESEDDIHEIEHYLAELHDQEPGGELPEDEILSEKEAAEILATVLEKRKRKTFVQTQKAKKFHELSRGYGGKPMGLRSGIETNDPEDKDEA